MTAIEENEDVVHQYYEVTVNELQYELLEELNVENVVNHDPLSDEPLTPDESRRFEGSLSVAAKTSRVAVADFRAHFGGSMRCNAATEQTCSEIPSDMEALR